MKKIATLLLMCLLSLGAFAQGWEYSDNKAIMMSDPLFLDGDYDNPTHLGLVVDANYDKDLVAMGLQGDGLTNFRENQLYVVVKFDWGKDERWRIKEIYTDDSKFKFFLIVSTDKFIKRLRSCDSLQVTLPVYQNGTQTFYFNCNGYPLDW